MFQFTRFGPKTVCDITELPAPRFLVLRGGMVFDEYPQQLGGGDTVYPDGMKCECEGFTDYMEHGEFWSECQIHNRENGLLRRLHTEYLDKLIIENSITERLTDGEVLIG